MFIKDNVQFTGVARTPEGYIEGKANFMQPGILVYRAGELERSKLPPEFQTDPLKEIRMLREDEVTFAPESLASFQRVPMTNDHPKQLLTAKDAKAHMVGFAFGDVVRTPENKASTRVRIMDAMSLDDIAAGKVGLSAGYDTRVEFSPGIHPLYGEYDAVQKTVVGNHIAITYPGMARGGSDLQLTDSSWENRKDQKLSETANPIPLVNVAIRGIMFQVTDQVASAIGLLDTDLKTATDKAKAAELALTDTKKELDTVKGELAAANAKLETPPDVEALVNDRLQLVDSIRKVCPDLDCTGKSEMDLKKEAIAKKMPTIPLTDANSDYINGIWGTLAAQAEDAKPATPVSGSAPAGHPQQALFDSNGAPVPGRQLPASLQARQNAIFPSATKEGGK